MPADTTPLRRKRNLMRWIAVVFVAVSAWGGWRVYAVRTALKQTGAGLIIRNPQFR